VNDKLAEFNDFGLLTSIHLSPRKQTQHSTDRALGSYHNFLSFLISIFFILLLIGYYFPQLISIHGSQFFVNYIFFS